MQKVLFCEDEMLLSQKAVEVHVGADAALRGPLHHLPCHAIHRGVRVSLADTDALRDAFQLLPGKSAVAEMLIQLSVPIDINASLSSRKNLMM